jgi:hypothetical protein
VFGCGKPKELSWLQRILQMACGGDALSGVQRILKAACGGDHGPLRRAAAATTGRCGGRCGG